MEAVGPGLRVVLVSLRLTLRVRVSTPSAPFPVPQLDYHVHRHRIRLPHEPPAPIALVLIDSTLAHEHPPPPVSGCARWRLAVQRSDRCPRAPSPTGAPPERHPPPLPVALCTARPAHTTR